MKKDIFYTICTKVFDYLNSNEQLTLFLEGEDSQYFRFNDSKLRQSGIIEDFNITLSLYHGNKSLQSMTTISSDIDFSVKNLTREIDVLRSSLDATPSNNNIIFPEINHPYIIVIMVGTIYIIHIGISNSAKRMLIIIKWG